MPHIMNPRTREPVGARFARKRVTGTDGFTRQWSLALNLASLYVNNYKPNKNKRLEKNQEIVNPDKGNGIVILNRKDYNDMMNDIPNDYSKFKILYKDVSLAREAKLQRYLLSLKKKGFFTPTDYEKIYPSGSSVARAYGLPKIHKLKSSSDKLKLRPIISSLKTYNYELSSFLAKLLEPCINKRYCAHDTFSFVSSSSRFIDPDNIQ